MSNVNFYPQNPIKQEQPVNSHYIQKILDENVSLIHTIMEKQQQHHTQESDELLKNLHKNLIYLATIADQTTSAGYQGPNVSTPSQFTYNGPLPQSALSTQNYHTNMPLQQAPQMSQPYMITGPAPGMELVDKKPHASEEDYNKEIMSKPDYGVGYNVDIDKDCEKSQLGKEVVNQPMVANKPVDAEREVVPTAPSTESVKDVITPKPVNMPDNNSKVDDAMFAQNQNSNIKTDMPPPSQLPLGVHPDKNPAHYAAPNQRFAYPAMNANFNQYGGPHYDQSNKFYNQNPYQQQASQSQPPLPQSPYNNYQGMYNPYQPVPPSMNSPGHYNQHMMNTGAMYSQYPYYQQQQQQPAAPMDHMASVSKDQVMNQAMHPTPTNNINQSMKQPITEAQPSLANTPMTE